MNTQHIQIQLLLPQSFSSRNHPILSPPQRLHHKKFTTFTIKRTSLFSYGGSGCRRSKFRCSVKDVEEQKQKQQLQVVKRAYPFHDIEPKWQTFWEKNRTFRTPDEIDTSKPKFYVLDMFLYPSGAGLHVGHPLGYTATDILAWLKRMQGYNIDMSMSLVGEVPLPHCCEKRPVIVDLLPGAPYNQQTKNCCKGGVLTSMS
ncbi:hypothetical protein Q3G72_024999 [Acer saccharum]|nr:hypothetical protein Q3G72_024999 [Acer saccharum]